MRPNQHPQLPTGDERGELPPSSQPPLETDEYVRKLLTDPALLAHLSDIVSVIDAELRFRYVSRGAGQRPSEIVGTQVIEHVAPHDRVRFRRHCEDALYGGPPRTLIVSGIDGRFWESRLVPTTDAAGRPLLFMASIDITARKRAERELAEREMRLRSAIEASGVGTWSWDCVHDEVVCDPGIYRILGRPLTRPLECYADYLTQVHPEDRPVVEAHVRRSRETGVYNEFEHRLVRPDGEIRHVLCRGAAVLDERGVVTAMRGGVYDITDRKRLEEQLRHVQKMEAIGQLTAGIAHNFNNLLSIALPNVELCRARAPAELHGLLDDVLHATDRAMELVRQLMRFARQENSRAQVATDLGVLAHHTAKICRATFERRIEIAVLAAGDLPPVLARPGEIEQVFLNICLNARDAFDDAHTAEPRITIRVERAGESMVRVSIADNGPGMDEAIRARMFEPFFTTKDISKGTGLGLASAYATVVDHRGHIRCESTKGVGTCFAVELPVAAVPAASAPCEAPLAASRGSEGILLVDDEALVRRALRAVLEQAGFRVFEAGDGSEGLSLLSRQADAIDVIVLDRSMPRMSGDEFLAQLGSSVRSRVPVVLLTGHASDEPDLDGVDAVMMKPPRSVALLRAIRDVLDARRQ